MWAALTSRALASRSGHPLLHHHGPWRLLEFLRPVSSSSLSSSSYARKPSLLELEEVEKILGDVKADDVRVIPVGNQCDWTDFMVVATGRSTWHVRNIAQALIHKAGLVFLTLILSYRIVTYICLYRVESIVFWNWSLTVGMRLKNKFQRLLLCWKQFILGDNSLFYRAKVTSKQ